MNFDELNGKNIIVTQIKSSIGYAEDQRQTLNGLGLKGIRSTSELKCTKAIYGMLVKVRHLIDIKIKQELEMELNSLVSVANKDKKINKQTRRGENVIKLNLSKPTKKR